MITINGKFNGDVDYIVSIPVDSFEDICEDNMSIKESDKIIAQAISEKYSPHLCAAGGKTHGISVLRLLRPKDRAPARSEHHRHVCLFDLSRASVGGESEG